MAALVGGVISAAGTYLGIRWRIRHELEATYDEGLRTLRLGSYGTLWALTADLAAFAPDRAPTVTKLKKLSAELTGWYYDTGGLYLSEDTRNACVALQRALWAVTTSERSLRGGRIDDATFESLRKIASGLRTEMTYDVGTRRPFPFQPKAQETEEALAADPRQLPADAPSPEERIFELWSARPKRGSTGRPDS